MKGHVDEALRALLPIRVSNSSSEFHEVVAWVDTAFNGSLVLPRSAIEQLGLVQASSAEAVLGDGNTVQLETFACTIEWFGKTYDTQIVANDSS